MRVMTGRKTDVHRLAAVGSGAIGAGVSQGATAHFNVAVVPAVGQLGEVIAQTCLQRCEADRTTLENWFGVSVPHFNIIVAPLSQYLDGTGGAFHSTCSATDLYCDAKVVPSIDPLVTCSLAVAEEVEVYEATLGGGWDCGASNGEGLSRVLSEELYLGVTEANGYAVASSWLDSFRPDYVNVTAPTDLDPISSACSVLFLNYLHYVLKYRWDQICKAPSATLTGTYQRLTSDLGDPFPKFLALLNHMYPPGQPSNLNSDNPWAA